MWGTSFFSHRNIVAQPQMCILRLHACMHIFGLHIFGMHACILRRNVRQDLLK
jgi:hypothetical protein